MRSKTPTRDALPLLLSTFTTLSITGAMLVSSVGALMMAFPGTHHAGLVFGGVMFMAGSLAVIASFLLRQGLAAGYYVMFGLSVLFFLEPLGLIYLRIASIVALAVLSAPTSRAHCALA